MKLLDKVIILTGASDGIGKALALRLAHENCQLALIGRDQARLDALLPLIKEAGSERVKVYSCDISDTVQLQKTVDQIKKDFPSGPNILINNAGIWHKMMEIEELDPTIIDQVIQTNLTSHIHLTRMILPGLKKAQDAAILNVISKSGLTAQKGQSVYSASKWGMKGFTEVLKTDLKDTKIRVAGVYQSGTNTEMFRKAGETFSTDSLTPPEDLAEVITFMLSRPKKIWLHEIHVQY